MDRVGVGPMTSATAASQSRTYRSKEAAAM
jgi:hypothetical protein